MREEVHCNTVSYNQILCVGFVIEFQDKVTWELILQYQKLIEYFTKEFIDRVYWEVISKYQTKYFA